MTEMAPPAKWIDLRSDTVTRPGPRMRKAMADAEVGDDVFGEDPTINRLEAVAAGLFGREAGVFVPSGTMGNLICLCVHARRGEEAIVEARSHIYNFEMGGIGAIAGLVPRVVYGEGGLLDPSAVQNAIQTSPGYRSRTALLCLENTHNLAGGAVYPTELISQLCSLAVEHRLKTHLDGARIFNAAVALGKPVEEITREFDSMTFCFSKGLGAPVGSMILGSDDFVAEARRVRKILGGGMRQAGVLAAAALVALEDSPGRLREDHENASRLARALAELPGIRIEPVAVRTNIVIADIEGTGLNSAGFLARLKEEGILAVPVGRTLVRFVTHLDVSPADVDRAIEGLRRVADSFPGV